MKALAVYDRTKRWKRRLAFLENAYDIQYTQQTNAVWTGSFKLPYSDWKKQYCTPLNYVEMWDINAAKEDRYVGLFKILPIEEHLITQSEAYILYSLEHVMGSLLDSHMRFTLAPPPIPGDPESYEPASVSELITQILDNQEVQYWNLGECDYDDLFELDIFSDNLLNSIYLVLNQLSDDYYWTFDTEGEYPWTMNLKKVSNIPIADIRYKKNIFGINKKTDPRSICTRMYLYGKDHLTISSINGGYEYIDSLTGIENYGIIALKLEDERFEVQENLLAYGNALLSKLDKPFVTYTVDIQTIFNAANLKIGDSVRVVTEDGLDDVLVVQEITKNDVSGSPNSGTITIGQGTVNMGLIVKGFI